MLNSTSTSFTATGSTGNLNFFQYGGGSYHTASKLAGLWIWENVALTAGEISAHATNPWQMCPSPSSWYLDYLAYPAYTFNAAGLAISGGYGGTGETVIAPAAGFRSAATPAARPRVHRPGSGAGDQRGLRWHHVSHILARLRPGNQRFPGRSLGGPIAGRGGHGDQRALLAAIHP